MKKHLAFTLAETLIVMGVIGVVAALTLPNLNQSTGNKEKVAKVKKIYQNLTDAFGRAQAIYGPLSEWKVNNSNTYIGFGDRITEFMKLSKNCKTSTGCFKDNIQNCDMGTCNPDKDTSMYKFILADGTSISLDGPNTDDNFDIYVDIDGPNKGANTAGKDIFLFREDNGNLFPYNHNDVANNCIDDKGSQCSGWIIQNENMDYLKADRSGKCPNETILSATNTSCN